MIKPRPSLGDASASFAEYGIGIHGLPPGLPATSEGPSGRSLQWRASQGPVPGPTTGWAHEYASGINIGWGRYADFEFEMLPAPIVNVTYDKVSELESALAFLLSVLPLSLPFFDLEPLHGSAVDMYGEGVLLLGDSGSGKSSTAAQLESLGCSHMTIKGHSINLYIGLAQLLPSPLYWNFLLIFGFLRLFG